MSISNMLTRFSSSVSIQTPSTTTSNQFGQYEYNSISTIQGRYIEIEEIVYKDSGDKEMSKAKLYTNEVLQNHTKIGDYRIFHKRIGKNKNNTIQWYLYFLK